jgi:hypothetical protein
LEFLLLSTIIGVAQPRMMTCTSHVERVEDIRMHREFYDKSLAKEKQMG